MEKFDHGIDAATASSIDHDKGVWFFRGDTAAKTNRAGDDFEKGRENITAEDAFPALENTSFGRGKIDACLKVDSGYWFFSGSKCAKTTNAAGSLSEKEQPIGDAWPALAKAGFDSGIDAAVETSTGRWFFKGSQCVKTDSSGDKILTGPEEYIAKDAWRGLDIDGWRDGIDAAFSTPGGFWFFKGTEAIKTDDGGSTIVTPPAPYSKAWPALARA